MNQVQLNRIQQLFSPENNLIKDDEKVEEKVEKVEEKVEDEKVEEKVEKVEENVEDEKVEDEKVEDEKVEDEKVEDEKVEDEKVEDEKVEWILMPGGYSWKNQLIEDGPTDRSNISKENILSGSRTRKSTNKSTLIGATLNNEDSIGPTKKMIEKHVNGKRSYENTVEKTREDYIREYLDKIEGKIMDKNLMSFWVFPDEDGFGKKGKGKSCYQMTQKIQKNLSKYVGRTIVSFIISCEQNNPCRKYGVWLRVESLIYKILPDGNLCYKDHISYDWSKCDFDLTKFSFKLVGKIMYSMIEHGYCSNYICEPMYDEYWSNYMCGSISGIINSLKKKNVDFDNILNRLVSLEI